MLGSKAQVHWSPWWSARAGSYLVKRVASKQAGVVRDAIIEMLTPYIEQVHTITFDNGGEFAEHKAIEEALGAEILLCAPYLQGTRSEREQQWAVEAVYPKGNRPERGHGRGCQESGAVAQPTTSEMSLGFRQPVKVFESTVRRHRRASH